MKLFKLSVLFIFLFALTSCGGNDKKKEESTPKKEVVVPKKAEPKVDLYSDIEASNDILLTSSDASVYSQEVLKVEGGKKVKLTFKHTGKMDKKVMGHNFVLLKDGVSMATFGKEAAKAVSNNYIPENTQDVIAYTNLIGGGEETTIEFDAPAPGTYRFICTFPGHYVSMKGTFVVI
jgi:azurin